MSVINFFLLIGIIEPIFELSNEIIRGKNVFDCNVIVVVAVAAAISIERSGDGAHWAKM